MLALWKDITWSEGFRVGWLLTWRAFVYGFVVGAVIGFVVGFVGAIIGANPQSIFSLSFALPIFVSPFVVWPVIVSQMLRKRFKGFRLRIEREERSIPPGFEVPS